MSPVWICICLCLIHKYIGTVNSFVTPKSNFANNVNQELEGAIISERAPAFLLSPRSQTVLSQGIAIFTCGANGSPLPEVFWTVNDKPVLYDKQRFTVRRVMTELHHWISIQIDDVRYRADNGLEVICIADNGIGNPITARATLTVLQSRKEQQYIDAGFPVISPAGDVMMTQYYASGTEFTLPCNFTGDTPVIRVNFYRNLQLVRTSLVPDEMVVMNSSKEYSGEYICSVENLHGTAYSQPINVYIGEPAKIILPPNDHRVKRGGRVSFYCGASGDPSPKVTWKVKDLLVGDDLALSYDVTQVENGSVLVVNHVSYSRDHRAEFLCEVTNQLEGTDKATALLEVYQEDEVPGCYPRILTQPKLKAVVYGDNTTLKCTAEGSPRPWITWLRGGVPVNTSQPWYTYSDSGSLIITHVDQTDQGFYECVAENSIGVAYSHQVYLYVDAGPRSPEIITLPQSPMTVASGDDVELTCEAVGTPMPYIEWSIAGSTVLTDTMDTPLGRGSYTVYDILEDGVYACRAYSVLGEITRLVRVTVT